MATNVEGTAAGTSVSPNVAKVLVAVHGIGDQFNYATVQSVALRLSAYHGMPAPIPLGRFYPDTGPVSDDVRILVSPPPPGVPSGVGFAEVYWAGIPRDVVKKGYELEESKKWAKTIVGRVHARAQEGMLHPHEPPLIESVLEEMIDTIAVLERLCFIAEKAGVFKFNLQSILADVVNDVQLVADFPSYRKTVLDRFEKVLAVVAEQHRSAAIYLIAHSEGTVVTLAGLLRAITATKRPTWLERVRGVMTIGSPLDAHMVLWPEMWTSPAEAWTPSSSIPWYNYYDYGDPIADSLTSTKQWLEQHRCGQVFDIHNVGFGRYLFPGKAHIDYWNDEHVFGHFIEEVIDRPPEPPRDEAAGKAEGPPPKVAAAPQKSAPAARRFSNEPGSKPGPMVGAYVAPYAVISVLFFVAVFALYRSVRIGMDLELPDTVRQVFWDVFPLAALLAGTTVFVRIPRLSRLFRWHAVGALVFLIACWIYAAPIKSSTVPSATSTLVQERIASVFYHGVFSVGLPAWLSHWGLLIAAAAVALGCAWASRKWSRWGVRILLMLGGVVVLLIAGVLISKAKAHGPVWPMALGIIAFFYLWWLAALLFDLVFVWHRYIRHSMAVRNLRDTLKMNVDAAVLTSTKQLQDKDYANGIETFWQEHGWTGSFTGQRGLAIKFIAFVQPDRARERGALVIASGRTETYLKYKELVFDLWNNGYSVYIHDHRGQGLSAREAKVADRRQRGYVEDFSDFVTDLRTFVDRHVRPGQHRNHFLLAHSMGGAIASLYLEEVPGHPFLAAALSSPMHAIQGLFHWDGEAFTCKVARLLTVLGQETGYTMGGHDYDPKPFEKNDYTSSPIRYQRLLKEYENEEIRLGSATHGWYARACSAARRACDNAGKIAIPLLLFQAGGDRIVHAAGQAKFCANFAKSRPEGCGGPDGGPIVIAGAKHELFIEDDDKRNQVLAAILNFFDAHQQ